MLIIMVGPSGVGKNAVIDLLKKRNPKLCSMKTVTTRKKRKVETGPYIFVSEKEFADKIKNGEFFEYENVHANIMYGTLLATLEEVKTSKQNFIKDIDVHGAIKIQKYLGRKICKTIFLDAPDDVLYTRLKNRGESEEMIKIRMSRYEMERKLKKHFDFIVENIDLEKTVKSVEDFIGTENLT